MRAQLRNPSIGPPSGHQRLLREWSYPGSIPGRGVPRFGGSGDRRGRPPVWDRRDQPWLQTMVHNARASTGSEYPSFPFIRERIGENPARWLQYCHDGRDRRVNGLRDGMRDPERAQNWSYVAQKLGVAPAVRQDFEDLVDVLTGDGGEETDQREVARAAAPRLRALWQADAPDTVRELQAAEVEGPRRQVVVALANHRLDVLDSVSDDAAEGAEADDSEGDTDADDAVSAHTREDISPADYDQDDYDAAVAFCRDFGVEQLREFLAKEQSRDQSRPAKLAAITDVLDEKTTDMTTTDEAATAATEAEA